MYVMLLKISTKRTTCARLFALDWKAGMTNNPTGHHRTSRDEMSAQPKLTDNMRLLIGNESVPKIKINDTLIFFLKLESAFWYILFEKYITILALEIASPWNRHCANFIGTLWFSI